MRTGIVLLLLLALPAALARTARAASDPCQGPDANVDIEKNMPPIYDQHRAEWCETFVAKTLLDYNIHLSCQKDDPSAGACPYTPETSLSASDLQSDNSAEDPGFRGRYIDLGSPGSIVNNVLEGAQRDGALTDAQLPLDQELFVGSGTDGALIERLSDYYDEASKQRPKSDVTASGNCDDGNDPFKDLESRYPLLERIATQVIASDPGSAGKTPFMDQIARTYYPIPETLQAQRKPVPAAFNIVNFYSTDPVALKSHIVDVLHHDQPVAIPLCVYHLFKLAHMDEPENPGDDCGPHAMVIVGFRKSGDRCEVHLRNTWGNQWPESIDAQGDHGDGTIWVDMNQVVQSEEQDPAHPGVLDTTSVVPRKQDSPIQNELIEGGQRTLGETWQYQLVGKGTRYLPNGTREIGTFTQDGILSQGTRIAKDGTQVWGKFRGVSILPVCGAVKDPIHGIYCVKDGKIETYRVSSPDRCACVR